MTLQLPVKLNPKDKWTSANWNKAVDVLEYLSNITGLVSDHIEIGKVANIDTSKAGIVSGSVAFSRPFEQMPFVFLSLEDVNIEVLIGCFWCDNVSLNGFDYNLKITKTKGNTYCKLNWLAIK
jgi:uncharacterized membrane protein YkgB